jgi:hypothetical protein
MKKNINGEQRAREDPGLRPTARFQIELLEERLKDIERMQRLSGSRTKREICEHAFTVLRTVLEQAAQGNQVGFLKPNGDFLELVYPPLENARRYEEKKQEKQANAADAVEAEPRATKG